MRTVKQTADDRYHLIKSPANESGQFGMLVGISKTHPFASQTAIEGTESTSDLFFQESDFTIVATTPRSLILKVQRIGFRCIIIAAHAPHTGLRCWRLKSSGTPLIQVSLMLFMIGPNLCLQMPTAGLAANPVTE